MTDWQTYRNGTPRGSLGTKEEGGRHTPFFNNYRPPGEPEPSLSPDHGAVLTRP